jgi:hypothetical protein
VELIGRMIQKRNLLEEITMQKVMSIIVQIVLETKSSHTNFGLMKIERKVGADHRKLPVARHLASSIRADRDGW